MRGDRPQHPFDAARRQMRSTALLVSSRQTPDTSNSRSPRSRLTCSYPAILTSRSKAKRAGSRASTLV